MQNKGMIRTFAIVLALVCLYHLSFTFFTKKVESDARAYANGDVEKEMAYLDSIANQPVYNFLFLKEYTYMECKSSEINFGLDLKGGMNIILEVKVSDIVKALSGYNTNPTFAKAVETAIEKEKTSTSDFITLFQESFESIDPNAQLATIFSTVELRDRIKNNMSNSEVISVLREETEAAISNAFNVLRTRIDRFGVTQPNIQRLEKAGRVLVELPGVTDPKRVRKLLQGTANLEFWETYNNQEIMQSLIDADAATREIVASDVAKKDSAAVDSTLALLGEESVDSLQASETYRSLFTYLHMMPAGYGPVVGVALAKDVKIVEEYLASDKVRRILPRDLKLLWTVKPLTGKQAAAYFGGQINEKESVYELVAIKQTSNNGKAPLEGDVITNARHNVSQNGSSYEVSMNMNSEGTRKWAQLTKANIGKSIAIVLDGYVYSFPTVQSEITGGSSQITGNFTPEEAQDLANVLKSGKLPAPATIVADNVVGPSLGQEAIESGLWSFLLAFCGVLIYILFFYGFKAGGVADFALICNLFFIAGILASFGAVLTLPGIAGIVLTIGMAVDANVIIYERIKEEIRAGKLVRNAVTEGYKNAMSAIVDANITTFLTALILFIFGTGPIQGFATTLMIGIVTSFFTAVFISRIIIEHIVKKNENMAFSTKMTEHFMENLNINFLAKRKIYFIVISVIMLICLGSLFTRGLSKGIDFTGGQIFVVRFDEPVSTVEAQQSLSAQFEGATVEVKTFGRDNQIRIATNYGLDLDQDVVETKLYEGLKQYIGADVDKDTFLSVNRQSSEKVGPTMASDIKEKAVYAIIFSLIVMFFYIFLRFRKWAYGASAVIALAHDVVFTLGVFSLFYSVMPFSMEIDQSFVAAILTIVGYSINNTVVIFDRVRESFATNPKGDPMVVINQALNSTMARTFNTSATTLVTLFVILVFGGEVVRGFVFAMTTGIFIGTFSSVLLATPLAYTILTSQKNKKKK